MPKKKFNPEGKGYDYETARSAGLKPNKTGHWPSREPKSGVILKGTGHETFNKTKAAEARHGYEIHKKKDGRYYSRKKRGGTWGIKD